ncbi:phospholipid scramblase family protein [Anaeromyxobacter oryzae]|uniref:Scramblase n=1 Tax=Anaeromyxobacter oryzae TaxID=2918170 RepID=A0ABM7X4H5_9BACT|nr:phospholipid scramblase family protein [Anaeromyxobacter oryzae]BDG06710.1 hypothetical protein AMOR_57060 [Anaeromyxobacter oryzae]
MRSPPLPSAELPLAHVLDAAPRLVVRQARDWTELLDLEAPNRYALLTESGALAGMAAEYPGGAGAWIGRWWLRARRPFEIGVYGSEERRYPALRFRRPWTWWLSVLEVTDADGRPVGTVRQRFTWFRRRLDLEAPDGRVLARVVGPVWRPWTFLVEAPSGREVGRIEKRWSGAVTELLTNADTYRVTMPPGEPRLRRLVLGAAVLADFLWFEEHD